MKRLATIWALVMLCNTLPAGAAETAEASAVTIQFRDIAEITKVNNISVQALSKQAAAFKAFDFFRDEQDALFDESSALDAGQSQLNTAIDAAESSSNLSDSAVIDLLQKSIAANTSAISGLL